MSARPHPACLTYDDYLLLPDDGRRHEVVQGEHVVTPSPSRRHQRIATILTSALHAFVADQCLGEVYAAPFDVILSEGDIVQPDLLLVTNEHLDRITDRGVRGAPDLAVEILSEASRRLDETTKCKLYGAAGVVEYWVVDPEIEIIKIYRRTGAGFVRVAELSVGANDTLTSSLLPGMSLPLASIFR